MRPLQPLIAAAIALVGGGLLLFGGQASGDAEQNRALSDTEATTRVLGDVSGALTRIFSYEPDQVAVTEQAAAEVLAGKAADQYKQLLPQVRDQAPAQRLTLTTRVIRAGLTSLSGDTAQVLVFLDQVATRNGKPAGTPAAAQLSITARFSDGRWRITDLKSS